MFFKFFCAVANKSENYQRPKTREKKNLTKNLKTDRFFAPGFFLHVPHWPTPPDELTNSLFFFFFFFLFQGFFYISGSPGLSGGTFLSFFCNGDLPMTFARPRFARWEGLASLGGASLRCGSTRRNSKFHQKAQGNHLYTY